MNHFMKHFTMGAIFGFAILVSGAGQASALLIGQDIETSVNFPNKNVLAPGSVAVTETVVNGGLPEYESLAAFFGGVGSEDVSIDLMDTQILIEITDGGPFVNGVFNGLHFFDVLSAIPDWTVSVSVNTLTGFNPGTMLDFDANNIFINVQGLTLNTGESLILDISTSPIPEPSTILLFGVGMAGLLAWRARKRRA